MGQAVGQLLATLIVIVIAIGIVVVSRELWCWLLKLTSILDELRFIRVELEKLNAREEKRGAGTRIVADNWSEPR